MQMKKAHSKDLLKLVQKYDTDRSGGLNAEELRSLIVHDAFGREHDA